MMKEAYDYSRSLLSYFIVVKRYNKQLFKILLISVLVVRPSKGDKAKKGKNKGKRVVNGWKNAGLPWTYSMDKDLMYFTK